MKTARRFLVWNCFDCNWTGNRLDDYVDEIASCPECGEAVGNPFWVQEDARWAEQKS